jgi:hypothetical protein
MQPVSAGIRVAPKALRTRQVVLSTNVFPARQRIARQLTRLVVVRGIETIVRAARPTQLV